MPCLFTQQFSQQGGNFTLQIMIAIMLSRGRITELLGLVGLINSLSMALWFLVSSFISTELLAKTKRVAVISHRGGMGNYPQGSFAAIDHSLAIGVDVIELDVRMSFDAIPIIYHDSEVNTRLCRYESRTEQPASLRIDELSYAEIQRFRCGGNGNAKFPNQIPATERIHSLDIMLAHIVSYDQQVQLMLELKPIKRKRGRTFINRVLQTLHKHDMAARTNIQSRHPQYLRIVDQTADQLGIELLKGYTALPMQLSLKIGHLRRWLPYLFRGELVYFTANDPEQWDKLLKSGATGIITDYPDKLQQYLAEQP